MFKEHVWEELFKSLRQPCRDIYIYINWQCGCKHSLRPWQKKFTNSHGSGHFSSQMTTFIFCNILFQQFCHHSLKSTVTSDFKSLASPLDLVKYHQTSMTIVAIRLVTHEECYVLLGNFFQSPKQNSKTRTNWLHLMVILMTSRPSFIDSYMQSWVWFP